MFGDNSDDEGDASFLACDSQVASFGVFPVDDLPNLVDVVQADVLVVNVVGMLPNVNRFVKDRVLRRGVRPAGAIIS